MAKSPFAIEKGLLKRLDFSPQAYVDNPGGLCGEPVENSRYPVDI